MIQNTSCETNSESGSPRQVTQLLPLPSPGNTGSCTPPFTRAFASVFLHLVFKLGMETVLVWCCCSDYNMQRKKAAPANSRAWNLQLPCSYKLNSFQDSLYLLSKQELRQLPAMGSTFSLLTLFLMDSGFPKAGFCGYSDIQLTFKFIPLHMQTIVICLNIHLNLTVHNECLANSIFILKIILSQHTK